VDERLELPGSETPHGDGGSWLEADPSQRVTTTLVIRRPQQAGELTKQLLSGTLPQMSRDQAEQLLRVDPADLAALLAFAHEYGLQVSEQNANARTVHLEGTLAQLGRAFGVEVQRRIDEQARSYLSYRGALTVPANLAGIVEAVLGLDQRPIARRKAAQ